VGCPRRRGGGGRRAFGDAVVRARKANRGEEQDREWKRTTRGGRGSRRWTAIACTAAAGGEALPAAEQNRAGAHVREEEEEMGGGPGDLFAISKQFKDLSVN
jgi:hypothetical protein